MPGRTSFSRWICFTALPPHRVRVEMNGLRRRFGESWRRWCSIRCDLLRRPSMKTRRRVETDGREAVSGNCDGLFCWSMILACRRRPSRRRILVEGPPRWRRVVQTATFDYECDRSGASTAPWQRANRDVSSVKYRVGKLSWVGLLVRVVADETLYLFVGQKGFVTNLASFRMWKDSLVSFYSSSFSDK